MADMLSVNQTLTRLKSDGLPLTEYALRMLIKRGAIPVRYVGQKALLYYPNIISYLRCEDGSDNIPAAEEHSGIRRVNVGG